MNIVWEVRMFENFSRHDHPPNHDGRPLNINDELGNGRLDFTNITTGI